jgi:hypothetical protein
MIYPLISLSGDDEAFSRVYTEISIIYKINGLDVNHQAAMVARDADISTEGQAL